ncbi:MAG: UbiA family prenyltransferase [Deltaproteobacteria bacterium]|nr:UbiA family prenyltransferase [Deltaproteobacteria bacterium]
MPQAPDTPWNPPQVTGRQQVWRQVAVGVRARQWWYFLVLPAAGIAPAQWRPLHFGTLLDVVHGAAVVAGCLAFAYGVNGLTERHTDLDPRKNPWIGQTPAKGALELLTGVALATLAIALTGSVKAMLAAAVSLAAGAVYSLGPRAKRKRLVGTGLNVLIFAPLLLVAPSAVASARSIGWAAAFSALLLQNQLVHEQVDDAEDRAAGAQSTAAWLGPKRTEIALLALGLTAVGAAWLWFAAPVASVLTGTALAATGAVLTGRAPLPRRTWQRGIAAVGGGLAFATEILTASAGPL